MIVGATGAVGVCAIAVSVTTVAASSTSLVAVVAADHVTTCTGCAQLGILADVYALWCGIVEVLLLKVRDRLRDLECNECGAKLIAGRHNLAWTQMEGGYVR